MSKIAALTLNIRMDGRMYSQADFRYTLKIDITVGRSTFLCAVQLYRKYFFE